MLPVIDPFKELREIEKRISSMLDLERAAVPAGIKETMWAPAVNEKEDEGAYYLEVDLPGVKKEDISVEVKDNIMTISGERKFKKEEKDKGYVRTESFFGKFERRFTLPSDVDAQNIEAKTEDGILHIKIPKLKEKENSKKIEIK